MFNDYDYYDYDPDAPLIECALCGMESPDYSRFTDIEGITVCRNNTECRLGEFGRITDAPGTVTLEIHICSERRGYLATFYTESQVMEFLARLSERDSDYRLAYGYGNHAIDEIEESPIPDTWTRLRDYLYPQCAHGLSLALCADPVNHYPADM